MTAKFMGLLENTLVILILIVTSAFFAFSEISLSAARAIKLEPLRDEGDARAAAVLSLQQHPGRFFTAVQIGLNAVAILGGIIGEGAYAPAFAAALEPLLPAAQAEVAGSVLSFVLVTLSFVLFADLIPKRVAIVAPEAIALRIAGPMHLCLRLLTPLIWSLNGIASRIMKLFGLPEKRPEDITPEDIVALAAAGAAAGVVARQEQELIENVFELETLTAPAAMTARDSIVWLDRDDDADALRGKIGARPHARYPVCTGGIDQVVGYVDTRDILGLLLDDQPLSLQREGLLRPALILPETLSLAEILQHFKAARDDFALVINEYALVVGLVTFYDIAGSLIGSAAPAASEEQIVQRDANSWLVDGATTVGDLERVLDLPPFPDDDQYETLAGFLMYALRKVPRVTDSVEHAGCKFEVVDIDHHRIDQVLVTRLPT